MTVLAAGGSGLGGTGSRESRCWGAATLEDLFVSGSLVCSSFLRGFAVLTRSTTLRFVEGRPL